MKTKHKTFNCIASVFIFVFFLLPFLAQASARDVLSKEEIFWLNERNNTIIFYPERNYPPFSYQSPGGNIQGLIIDYLNLIVEKLEVKVNYLNPQSKNQILSELSLGKGDFTLGSESQDKLDKFIFTESYLTIPTVIVVRKDYTNKSNLNLTDFNGKRISVVAGSVLYHYVRQNYPRVVVEDVTDNEVSLQQIVLGEVDAGVMDVASLSYFLSKQVLSSVKIGGNTGYDLKLSFLLPKDKTLLQSILEKGLAQITIKEREILNDKWVALPGREVVPGWQDRVVLYFGNLSTYIVFGILIAIIIILLVRRSGVRRRFFRKAHSVQEIKEDIKELEEANQMLAEELKEIQESEKELTEKLKSMIK